MGYESLKFTVKRITYKILIKLLVMFLLCRFPWQWQNRTRSSSGINIVLAGYDNREVWVHQAASTSK
jgi:hypothetical protein